jgi:hypothetical protein
MSEPVVRGAIRTPFGIGHGMASGTIREGIED